MDDNICYAVDEIIDDIAILENIETKEKEEVDIKKLPKEVREGSIIVKEHIYKLDNEYEKKRREDLRNRLNKLKG